jgi:hypothetical protein
VGLPGILNKKLYLLGVEGTPLLQSGREMDMHEEMLIHCSWDVDEFLRILSSAHFNFYYQNDIISFLSWFMALTSLSLSKSPV